MTRIVPVLVLAAMVSAATAAGAVPLHLPFDGASFVAGRAPVGVTSVYAADLNSDGRTDAVLIETDPNCTQCANGLTWLLRQPDGSLTPGGTLTCPDFDFTAAVVADVTGDGKLDLVLTSSQYGPTDTFHQYILGSAVRVYPGDGAGNFGAPVLVASDANLPTAVAAYDFSGDGRADLVLFNRAGSGGWSILRSLGDGQFAPWSWASDPVTWEDVAIGDVTGDGRPDVVGTFGPGMSIYSIPVAGGVVGASSFVSSPTNKEAVRLADIDGDGRLDIELMYRAPGEDVLQCFRSLGGGAFAAQPPVSAPAFLGDMHFTAADLDGDGAADLVFFRTDEGVNVYRSPRFGPLGTPTILHTSGAVYAFDVGDLDGDAYPDLMLASAADGATNVELHDNAGDGSFGGHEVPTGAGPVALATADFDGDGHLDMAVVAQAANEVTLLFGDGLGNFDDARHLPTGSHPSGVAAARLWSGGGVDLVTTDGSDRTVSLLRNLGGRNFAARQIYAVGSTPLGVAIGDVTGDGISDLVCANSGSNTISVLAGDGAGGFAPRVDFTTQSGPRSPVIADLNGDGLPDVAYALEFQNAVGVRLQGASGLGVEQLVISAIRPRQVIAVDLDHDGLPELASVGFLGTNVEIAHGDPANGWPLYASVNTSASPIGLTAADVDGDGNVDIAVVKDVQPTSAASVALVFGGGGTQLPERFRLGLGLGAVAITAADVTEDGRPDLLAVNGASGTVSVLVNRQSGAIVAVPAPPTHGSALSVLRLAPNPSRGGALAADLALPADGAVTARVVTLAGRALWSSTLVGRAGAQRLAVAAGTRLAPGVYWLDVRQAGAHAAQKFVILP